ncbi:MAG: cell division protein FtsA [Prevotella sp.]|nr:cell division protein FtsA [Bacteroides sp.]MCM1366243.1 cell division protein FtsA [Prevotella sp.]MCM1436352.1 cell division protein FtsA [Prevotella sp.]
MTEERYIAALELRSSKIIGTVGKTTGQGDLDVIAVEMEKGVEWIRYGIIQNLEETSIRISRIIEKLERKASVSPHKISSVFIGLSGRSLGSFHTEVCINLPEETEIDEEILQRLRNEAWRTSIAEGLEIVDAVPRIYKIGKQETHSPVGVLGTSISAIYDLITCRPEMKRNVEKTVYDKLHLPVAGYVVTALATGHLILSNDEKRLGCMLVDLGAETTTVTIYKNGNLTYFVTLPLGSRNITRDLTSLNVLEEAAEEIKVTSGNAIAADKPSSLNLGGLKLADVSNIIVARSEEIVANIIEQISYAGFKNSDLPGGIVGIGGGFKMNGMLELLANRSNLPVRRGRLPGYVRLEDTKYPAADILQAISILYAGATHSDIECLEIPQNRELPPIGEPNDDEYTIDSETGMDTTTNIDTPRPAKRNNLFSKITTSIGRIFIDKTPEDSDELY